MNKLSVVIPTLQKNKEFLDNLIKTLSTDESVTEIIVIDNSCTGYNFENEKLRVITPENNLYVNPSWNLGVKESKEEIVALLNDDIIIPKDFCKNVISQMNSNMGCIGFAVDYIKETKEMMPNPEIKQLQLEPVNERCMHWGIAIFFYKSSYCEIPDELKIFCGDDWIFLQNKRNHKQNYHICGQNIYHYGSLSSNSKTLNPIGDNDRKLYRKLTRHWWQFIFNIEPVYRGFRLTILGIELLHHHDKKH